MPNAISLTCIRCGTLVLPNVGPAPGIFVETEVGVTGVKVLCCPINSSTTGVILQSAIRVDNALVINRVSLIDFAHERPVCRVGHIQWTSNLCYISPFECADFVTSEYASCGRCGARTFLSGLRSKCSRVIDNRAIAVGAYIPYLNGARKRIKCPVVSRLARISVVHNFFCDGYQEVPLDRTGST